MSFGCSPTDAVTVAKLFYVVYRFCRHAPADLQGVSEKLSRIDGKLEWISAILSRFGLGVWEDQPTLKQHLLDIKSQLEPLLSSIEGKSFTVSKGKAWARLAFNQERLKRIEKCLDEKEKAISDIKGDIVLMCSLKTAQLEHNRQQASVDLRSSRRRSDSSALRERVALTPVGHFPGSATCLGNNVRKALLDTNELFLGQSTPSTNNELQTQRMDARFTDTTSLANLTCIGDADTTHEDDELYGAPQEAYFMRGALPPPTSDFRNEGEYAAHAISSSEDLSSQIAENYSDPSSGESGVELELSRENGNNQSSGPIGQPDKRFIGVVHSSESPSKTALHSANCHSHAFNNFETSRHFHSMSRHENSFANDNILEREVESIQVNASTCQDHERIPTEQINMRDVCDVIQENSTRLVIQFFRLEAREDLLFLTGYSKSSLHHKSSTVLPMNAATEQSTGCFIELNTDAVLLETFQHSFSIHNRPVPYILHPIVEGSTKEPNAPNTVEFTDPRNDLALETCDSWKGAASPRFVFCQDQDRKVLCEKVFGRKLVISVGSDVITYNGREVAHMAAVTLWHDMSSNTQSLAFYANIAGRKEWRRAVCLTIRGHWDRKQNLRNPKAVSLVAEATDDFNERRSSLGQKRHDPRKCVIIFTVASDKALFMGLMEESLKDFGATPWFQGTKQTFGATKVLNLFSHVVKDHK